MKNNDNLLHELSWIHISDIHATGRPGAENEHRGLVLQRLLEDLDRRAEIGAPDPTVVVITGDVAMSGGALRSGEYLEAANLIRSLVTRLGAGTRVMIVPGNHDTRRADTDDWATARMLRGAREGEERIDDLLVRGQDSELLERRLAGYRGFVSELADIDPELGAGSSVTGWSRSVVSRSLSARFVGLNTALLANDDYDQGKLQLGYAQLRTATEGATADVVMILLTHHPLDWLRDGDEVAPLLAEYFDLHLYGHLHLPQSSRSTLLQHRGLISIGAGATYHGLSGTGVGAGEYSYSIASLGWSGNGELKLRVWPRIWSARAGRWGADQAILDAGSDYGTYPVMGHDRDPKTLETPPEGITAWRRWSSRAIRNFGKRRTAYPLDLTIQELFERGVNIDTTIRDYASPADEGRRSLTATILAEINQNGSTLILGEPGAGKSVAAYEISQALAATGGVPIVLRASEFKALLSPGHEYAEVMSVALKEAATWQSRLALVIDGLDEMTDSSNAITLAGDFITAAAEVMTVVATCRRREFEDEISRWMPSGTFNRIYSVKEWTVTEEFREYVRRLVAARLLSGTEILRTVAASEVLSDLAARPLFARMLTYVGIDETSGLESATGLYVRYLDRLASSCAVSIREAGLETPVEPMQIWRSAAQLTFENGLIIDEELNYSAVELLLCRETGASEPVVRRAMAYVLDIRERGMVKYAQFVHYSFFEFLIASAIQAQLLDESASTDPTTLASRFRHDLPRRVRHFLTELLLPVRTEAIGTMLGASYQFAQATDLRMPVRRTVCNLIAYVVSRTFPNDSALLMRLLLHEDDPFLRDSLLWALCHVGSIEGVVTFIRELDNSIVRRQMNRGYLLYYHGDLSRDVEPPFMDVAPLRSWSYTRGEVLEMLAGSKYQVTVNPARQVIDLYTFFDFCISRSEVCNRKDSVLLKRLVDDLWTAGSVPVEVTSRLLAEVSICTDGE
jgi:Calcineurin-like phosphoesterase